MIFPPPLNWITQTISLFNTLLLLWLGLTVILNAERRTPGMWFAASQLLLGSTFFFSHSIILENNLYFPTDNIDYWWRFAWLPVVILPLAWYGVLLWYSGFWSAPTTWLRRRHTFWFGSVIVLALIILVLLVVANPLPSLTDIEGTGGEYVGSVGGIPWLVIIYPGFILLCLILAVDALNHPAPAERLMGDLARKRARPWLLTASVVLIIASLLVGWIMFWGVTRIRAFPLAQFMAGIIAWFDLFIAALVSAAILLVGQAIVSYEIFTGRTLPRSGLRHHWLRMIMLALGFSVLTSSGIVLAWSPIFIVLLSGVTIAVLYALLSWRSFIERDRDLRSMRSFLPTHSLFKRLEDPEEIPRNEVLLQPFYNLCSEVLSARRAYILPAGPAASLVHNPIPFPPHQMMPAEMNLDWSTLRDPGCPYLPFTLTDSRTAGWAVPLRDSAHLIGALILDEKRDTVLYTVEEIETARQLSERILADLASLELRRRLFDLQRQRINETHLLDQRSRQLLHDEILPHIHTAMLSLNSLPDTGSTAAADAIETLVETHQKISTLLRESIPPGRQIVNRIGLIEAWEKVLASELKDKFQTINWQVDPAAAEKIERLSGQTLEVLYYAGREVIRNAARHAQPGKKGRTNPNLDIRISWESGLVVEFCDDGQGVVPKPGTVTAGHGIALHSALLSVIGGSLTVSNKPGKSTCISLILPEFAWQDESISS